MKRQHKTKWSVKDLITGYITRHSSREDAQAKSIYLHEIVGHPASIIPPLYYD